MNHSPLEMLIYRRVRGKPLLTLEQGECLLAFARDWRLLKSSDMSAAALTRKPAEAGNTDDLRIVRVIDAKDRIVATRDRLGLTMFEVVSRVAGMEVGVEEVEKKLGIPARSAKLVIQIAAEQMASIYPQKA